MAALPVPSLFKHLDWCRLAGPVAPPCLRAVALALLAGLATLTGCSSTPVAERGPRLEPLLIDFAQADRLGYHPTWSTDVLPDPVRRDDIRYLSVIEWLDDLVVMVERPTNRLIALKASDGSIAWSMPARGAASEVLGVARYEDRLIFNTQGQLLVAKARTGEVVERFDLPYTAQQPLVLQGDTVLLGSANGRITALKALTGTRKWDYRFPGGVSSQPVVADQTLLATDIRGNYATINVVNGEGIWSGRGFGPIVASPAFDRVGMYVCCEDQAMYALDRTTGEDRWPAFRSRFPLTEPPMTGDLKVFIPIRDHALVALDAISGEELWRIEAPVTPLKVTELQGDRAELLTMSNRRIDVLRTADGYTLRSALTQPLERIVTGPEGSLLLVNPDGRMQRLDPQR